MLCAGKNINSIRNTLDRAPKQLCNSDKVDLSSRCIADIDLEHSLKTSIIS